MLGKFFGGLGVTSAAAVSLTVGSILTLFGNQLQLGGTIGQVLNRYAVIVMVLPCLLAAILIAIYPQMEARIGSLTAATVSFAVMTLAIFAIWASDPSARGIMRSLKNALPCART